LVGLREGILQAAARKVLRDRIFPSKPLLDPRLACGGSAPANRKHVTKVVCMERIPRFAIGYAVVSPLDDLLERIRLATGAEFAFVLTLQGKLVSIHAPRDMPEAGRKRLVRAANQVVGTGAITSVSLPRGEIVPFGGPGPIDITLAVAADRAIVCVVMTTAAGRPRAVGKLKDGVQQVESLMWRALESRGGGRQKWKNVSAAIAAEPAPPPRSARPEAQEGAGKRRAGAPKSKRPADTAAVCSEAHGDSPPPARRQAPSGPEIIVERARKVGRETLAAIEADLAASGLPRPRIPEAQLADMSPDVVVERARKVGRETMNAIEAEIAESSTPIPSPRIASAALRQTLPWVELPPDSELASRTTRKNPGPRVSIKVEEVDDELLKGALSAEVERIMDNPGAKSPGHPRSEARKGAPAEVKGPPRRT
jgi:hypothetical protein